MEMHRSLKTGLNTKLINHSECDGSPAKGYDGNMHNGHSSKKMIMTPKNMDDESDCIIYTTKIYIAVDLTTLQETFGQFSFPFKGLKSTKFAGFFPI